MHKKAVDHNILYYELIPYRIKNIENTIKYINKYITCAKRAIKNIP